MRTFERGAKEVCIEFTLAILRNHGGFPLDQEEPELIRKVSRSDKNRHYPDAQGNYQTETTGFHPYYSLRFIADRDSYN